MKITDAHKQRAHELAGCPDGDSELVDGYLAAVARMTEVDPGRLENQHDVDVTGYAGDDACVWIEAIGEHRSTDGARGRAFDLLVAADYADGAWETA